MITVSWSKRGRDFNFKCEIFFFNWGGGRAEWESNVAKCLCKCAHFGWWGVAICYMILDIGLLWFVKKYSSNNPIEGDLTISYFQWAILRSCHFAVASQMFGFFFFFPLSLFRDLIHVGKQYSSLGKKFKAHLPVYLPRALCLFVEPNFLYLIEWIAHDRWWPTTFGSWSILD